MKEFVEKLIGRLEEKKLNSFLTIANTGNEKLDFAHKCVGDVIESTKEIVKQLAEEYINTSTNISTKQQDLSTRIADDLSAVLKEAKSMGCKEVKYFHHIPLENVEIAVNALRAYNQGWIPCSERLPESKGNYLVCSKDVIWVANYFHNTWWGIEKRCRWGDVEAWQPLPDPYKQEPQKEIPTKHYEERFNRVM